MVNGIFQFFIYKSKNICIRFDICL